jgi:hypothetical protein
MNVDKCERCHQPTNNKTTMSMFNEDVICMSCKDKERQNPNYSKAETADIEQIKKGNYNYSGIGYLPDNYSEHAIMMDGEIYTGDSYYNIVSDQGPNFFNRDESERGYVDNKGEFYDEEIGNEYLAANGKLVAVDLSNATIDQKFDGIVAALEKANISARVKIVSNAFGHAEEIYVELGHDFRNDRAVEKAIEKYTNLHYGGFGRNEDYIMCANVSDSGRKSERIYGKKNISRALYSDGGMAADGKPIQEADYLTNAMLSVLDLKNYLDSHNDQIIINGSKYNYFSHAQYNLRVTGGQGAIYNIVPYFPESTVEQLQNGKFYTLLRKDRSHNFAISTTGLVLDIAEDGLAIA